MHIDLDFRPRNLFWPLAAETHLLSTIKGAERRSMAEAMLKSGPEVVPPSSAFYPHFAALVHQKISAWHRARQTAS